MLPHKQAAYDAKYSTQIRGGESFFRQVDREESLIHLLRVNVLKRMESAVPSFALTVKRQLADVEATLAKIEAHEESVEEIEIEDVDLDDPAFECLLALSACYRRGAQPDHAAQSAERPRQHPHHFLTAIEGTPGRLCC